MVQCDVEATVTIQDWSVCGTYDDPYMAPDANPHCLQGVVFGHPRKADGKRVLTTPIVKVDGRIVETRSGTVYRLGRVSRSYSEWMRKRGIGYDARNPIRDRSKDR